jgi:4,5-dihydroxyphthalate decarboxylase
MSDIGLSLAISYYDHVSDLVRGRVHPEGIRLTVTELPVEEIFFRMMSFAEWDVAELSMAKYVSLVASGAAPFSAIPVFPSRVFRQSAVYVATRAGIAGPQDLAGRRVGVPEWAQTAGIYARAYLQHQCGVRLEGIHWVQSGVNEPGRHEKVNFSLPAGIRIERVEDRSLNQMLLAGELDAIISAREPRAFVEQDPRIARLWPDYRRLEETYYRSTGIFPIMHVIVINARKLVRHPWIARNLFEAFEEAKTNSLRHAVRLTTSRFPFAWSHHAAVEATRVFGDDCWPYGIEPNRRTLEAFTGFCRGQGVTGRQVRIEELFPRELAETVKV